MVRMRLFFYRLIATAVMLASMGGCADVAALDHDALWKTVALQCVPAQESTGRPGQCTSVDLTQRYAILKDLFGRSQHLLIPTDRVTGIESPRLFEPGIPDYWVDAWNARHFVEASLDRTLTDEQIGLEINSEYRRSQDQLHIHMDCMRTDIIDALARDREDSPGAWRWETLDGVRYRIMRVVSLSGDNDPFRIVARDHQGPQAMATQTILVTGAGQSGGTAGWLIVNSGMDIDHGTGTAEGLLDHACRLADEN